MCHFCGALSENWSSRADKKIGHPTELNCGETILNCSFCCTNNCQVSVNSEHSSCEAMPSISPAASLRSTESSISNCSDFSVDASLYDRVYIEDSSTDSSQEDAGPSLLGDIDGLNVPAKINGFHQNADMAKQENGESNGTNVEPSAAGIVQERSVSNLEIVSSCPHEELETPTPVVEEHAEFWLPPEPEVQEDDMVGSVANYDDDDDEDGGMWAKTSSLSQFGEEGSGRHKFKEEKHKAMDDVRNGKFMTLVSQLIKSVGVDSSGNHGENWVDTVTSLSWEAASFVKPVAQEGKAMDPDGYVKIKCVATGSRSQSRVIKGLVFKKHAAHKHMPTKHQNPRLLLIHGSLDLSSDGLSSFQSMALQEKDNLKSIIDMIDMCHPDVILVEKSVSRHIQDSILAKGMTLVFDMKLHRLERVARCIGSPILSSEVAMGQKLRQCDSFHIEKFVEEHAVSAEGGKKQSKTLMFLEGAPTRQGCTILLMGANSEELKRIKIVVRCAVVMAYHFMLETFFLLDQAAMFSSISPNEVVSDDKQITGEITHSSQSGSAPENNPVTLEIPISNGFGHMDTDGLISSPEYSPLSFKPYGTASFPGLSLSTSIQEVMNDSFTLLTDSSQNIISNAGKDLNDHSENDIQISNVLEIVDQGDGQPKVSSEELNLLNDEQPFHPESLDRGNNSDSAEDHLQNKSEITSLFDSESILVLMSSRNASRGTICEQRHFSHIKFYRSFDVPLGKFLRDNLLNQRLPCKTCDESPEVHFYYYAHHNKQLTIQLKRLPPTSCLPGETEGKLWMWSRCGRCKSHDGNSKSTKRVLISSGARGLSFGKFLELSFSNHPSFNYPSSCGHSFQKDFLYFFGLGPMVAMFKYSTVATYSVSLPPQKMDFNSSVRGDFIKKDTENVYSKGISLFLDIEKSLQKLGPRYVGVKLNILGSSKNFSDIEEMLKLEKSQFEVDIQNAMKTGCRDCAVCKLLRLNRVRWELLLESCIWDQRLHGLFSSDLIVVNSDTIDSQSQEKHPLEEDVASGKEARAADITVEHCDTLPENTSEFEPKLDTVTHADNVPIKDIAMGGAIEESVGYSSPSADILTEDIEIKENGSAVFDSSAIPISEDHLNAADSNFGLSTQPENVKSISMSTFTEADSDGSNHSLTGKRSLSILSDREMDKGWIWAPFSDIRREYMEDIQRGYLPRFGLFNSYDTESIAQKWITDEGSRLHIPLGTNDYIVSDYEEEFSSIIACALTFLKDIPVVSEDVSDPDARKEGSNDSTQTLPRVFSLASPRWSSFGSSDADGIHSPPAHSLEDSHSSSFDSLDLLDSLVSYGADHPEVSMGLGKNPGRRKYSVVCLYASQFHLRRDRSCPSEVDYIASLSRCQNWDAKGGKSKSLFAKTLDDRFIIKEIKRTEFDSFMKFAPNYFDYMNQCHELGNQTCLAKILGIYQVVIRAGKNGKEARHDLLVMENLSFGRQIAKQYDLKGALHARFNTANGSGDVLLDQNFVNDMNVAPLYVSRKSKRHLQRAVYNDTNFLNSINVMDYSLLVGVDTQRRELVCGIIDYLRQYTWDKQLENWVKSSLVVPKNQLPTIVSPKEYKKRFRKFIDTHFLSVPDHWCSQRSLNPCKLCGPALESGSSHRRGNGSDASSEEK